MTVPDLILIAVGVALALGLIILLLAKGRHYEWILVGKYLRKRRIAWVSLIAVALCTTMVLVVISVMGGWLRMARTNFRGLSGDIIVQSGSLAGFGHYQEMMQEIQKLPEVHAAVPVIQTFGLININNKKTMGVQVYGYPMDRIGQVNAFPQSLWRQNNQWVEWAEGAPIPVQDRQTLRDLYKLDVREGEPLLELTKQEHDRLRDNQTKAQQIAADARGKLASTPPGGLTDEQYTELSRRSMLDRVFKGLVDRQFSYATVQDRKLIREALGSDVVADPDKLLAPNDGERKLVRETGEKMLKNASFDLFMPPEEYSEAFKRLNPKAREHLIKEAATWKGMIAGTGVVNIRKNKEGGFEGRGDFLYRIPIQLTVLGIPPSGEVKIDAPPPSRPYWIVDTSRTKVWQYDSNTVYVPFDVLQLDLGMQEQDAELDGKAIKISARTSEIHVSVKPGHPTSGEGLIPLRDKIDNIVQGVLAKHNHTGPEPIARTWEQSQAKWLGAIEKEMVLVTGLFGLISVVAIFLIFCIFYMIVVEKTKDIGIIKSVGATSGGVAGIFLGYGAAIGIVGAGLGLLLGWSIVHNINTLHDWLGKAMHVVIWDPEIYAFDTIPNTMNPVHVARILGAAIIASILGALVPAIRAARMHPVEALRWE
jgi:lipoprotein-releasing system permease protein